MKKAVLLIAIAVTGMLAVQAQGGGGGFQRRTPEERLKATKEKLADLKLDKDQTTKSDSVFMDFYKAQDKMREEMTAGGIPHIMVLCGSCFCSYSSSAASHFR